MSRGRFSAAPGVILLAGMLILGSIGVAGAVGPEQAQRFVNCAIQGSNVLVRVGPGTSFPAQGIVPQGTAVRAISFVKKGVPDGSWTEVELTPGTSIGFLQVDATSIRCAAALTTLPAGKIPDPVQARPETVLVAIDGGDLDNNPIVRGPGNVGNGQYVFIPGVNLKQVQAVRDANNNTVRFYDAVGFGVEPLDTNLSGNKIGNGIKEVRFDIQYSDPDTGKLITVYQTVEQNVPYCLFSDENGRCNVFRFSKMGNKWPDTRIAKGLPRPLGDTQYTAVITITPNNPDSGTNGDTVLWRFNFILTGLAVQFP